MAAGKSAPRTNGQSEGFPRTRLTKWSCACDCGSGFVSVSPFFFLLLSSFFFSHPESCLKIKILQEIVMF